MAGQITDGRTLLTAADSATNWVATSSATLDTEIFIEGTGSIAENITSSRRYVMYNNTSAIGLTTSDNLYIWINSGIVGLLATKANGGMAIRVAGANVANFAERYVAGSDAWPQSIAGGWTLFVINIGDILTNADATGGTPPTAAQIQHVGYSSVTGGTMPRNADNTWIDAIYYVAQTGASIIIEGDNAGTSDWSFADIYTQLGIANGTFRLGPGGSYVLAGRIHFRATSTYSTCDFSDSNALILIDSMEFVNPQSFGFVLDATLTTAATVNVTFGVVSGTGDDRTGSQGVTISASAADLGDWAWRVQGPTAAPTAAQAYNQNIYGSTFVGAHEMYVGGVLVQNDADITVNTTWISSLVSSCDVFYGGDESFNASVVNLEVIRCTFVNGTTTYDVYTNDTTQFKYCSFVFGTGHAINVDASGYGSAAIPATQELKGNTFDGFGADGTTTAALWNQGGKAVTFNITDGGDIPTVRTTGVGTSTTLNNAQPIVVSGLTEGAAVKVIADETVGTVTKGDVIFEGLADASGDISTTINYESAFNPSGLDVIVRARQQGLPNYAIFFKDGSYADQTTAANSSTVDDMTFLNGAPASAGEYYFGMSEQFFRMKIDVSQAGVGTYTGSWQYWTGSVWIDFSGTVDGTNNFKNSGLNYIELGGLSTLWPKTTINSVYGPSYFVRWRYASGTVTTNPLGRKASCDVTRYLPFTQDRIITSTGLTVFANWTVDSISTF